MKREPFELLAIKFFNEITLNIGKLYICDLDHSVKGHLSIFLIQQE